MHHNKGGHATKLSHAGMTALQLEKKNIIINNLNKKSIMAYVIGEDCIACGTCIGECPVEAISEGDIYSIDPDLCTECGTCASVCPNEAISLP